MKLLHKKIESCGECPLIFRNKTSKYNWCSENSKDTYVVAEIYEPGTTARGSRRLYGLIDPNGMRGVLGAYRESDLLLTNGIRQAILRISERKIKRETELQLPPKKKRSKTKKKRYNKKKEKKSEESEKE